MLKNKKRMIGLTIAALILVMSLETAGFAAGIQATLSAQYKAIKILFNGQQVTMETQPVIINGSTYLPLRALANIFNKNIEWTAATQQVTITDKPDNQIAALQAQIKEKDNQILVLQTQLAAKSSSGSLSLSDMQKQLNKDYGDYEDLDVNITLSGTKSKITVKVDIGDEDDWDELSGTKQTKLLQKIVDDLLDEYEDADISGTVKDGSKTIKTFTVNSSGTVKTSSSTDLDDFADELEDEYDQLGAIDSLTISLSGSTTGTITFTVKIKYSNFEYEWDDLTDSEIKSFMKSIKSDIEDEYEDASVKGYIVDSSSSNANMAYLNTSGNLTRYSPYK